MDSLTAPNTKKNNVSVIVRCSTPDPEATCSTNNPAFHFPNQVPEDFSIPLNYLFESFVQCETPPLPPRHPVYPNNTITVHPRGPEVPYTPPRHHQDVSSRDTSLIEGFRSPRISALLEPLIDLGATENTSKMSDLNRMKEECDEKLEKFNSLLRIYNPVGKNPVGLQENQQKWNDELVNALGSLTKSINIMTTKHKVALGTEIIKQWKKQIEDSEKNYHDHFNATYVAVTAARAQAPPPVVSRPMSEPAEDKVEAAQVDVSIEAERVALEGKKLDEEIKKYDGWGDATNEQIEEAMGKTEDWEK